MESLIGPFFLSYPEEDAVLARRIHDALKKAKAQVWGYKEDGRYGVDYEEELTSKISESRFFCLLDGPNARTSDWVRKECVIARQARAIMVVCRVKPLHSGPNAPVELFERQ